MRSKEGILVIFLVLLFLAGPVHSGILYNAPSGGWTYEYTGDAAAAGWGGFDALDGTWSHNNSSDQWDGNPIGSGASGGVSALSGGQTNFLRLQDPYGYETASNCKLYFAHEIGNISSHPEYCDLLDDGITLSFRARLSTALTGPVDDRELVGHTVGFPVGGKGYPHKHHAKGHFGVKQGMSGTAQPDPQLISFCLVRPSEGAFLEGKGGLIMNSLVGTTPTEDVDFGMGTLNIVEVDDLDSWHEFWITIQAETSGGGTHRVTVYKDGETAGEVHHVTISIDDLFSAYPYQTVQVLGLPGDEEDGAFDVDFFAYKIGVVAPTAVPLVATVSDPCYDGGGPTVVMEGGFNDTLEVVLTSDPGGAAKVTLTPSSNQIDLGMGAGNSQILNFDSGNWNQPQTVTITANDDGTTEGLHSTSINSTYSEGGTILPHTVYIVDNETASVVIRMTDGILVDESNSDTGTYTVWLTKTSGTVTITPEDNLDPCEVVISSGPLIFTSAGSQAVTVRAFDDSETSIDPHFTIITHDISGATLQVPSVTPTILENDCGAWGYSAFDINRDCQIDVVDLAEFVSEWFNCSDPKLGDCISY